MDLRDVDIDDLIADISSHATKEPAPIDKWLEAEGYYPGSTRVLAAELHRRYVDWRVQHPDIVGKVEDVRRFGMVLRGRFKFGKLNVGNCYYISRESLCILDPSLDLAPLGNRGGTPPVVPKQQKAQKTK